MIRLFLCCVFFGIAALGVVYAGATKDRHTDKASVFVGATGTSFTTAGQPLFIAGVNNHYLTWGTDLEVNRVLDDTANLGANTIRLFLQPVIGSLDGSMPTIWNWKKEGDSNDLAVRGTDLLHWDSKLNRMAINDGPTGLQRLDRVLVGAKQRNLKLIIGFLDFWSYTGGAQQMTAWYVDEAHRPTSEGPKPVTDYHFFFSDERTRRDYKEWVKHVLQHVNRKTGLEYRSDPTIAAWELMNEPIFDSDTMRYQWINEMSAFVKSIDPHHLVASGSINKTPFDLAKDLVIPTIDYGTWHTYPIHDKITPEELAERIPRYCATAALYKKPLLLEEFGYARSNPDQIEAYEKWLDAVTNNHDCAGWVVWKLASLQENDRFPEDAYDQFDVRRDGGPLWTLLKAEIGKAAERRRIKVSAKE